MSPTELGENLEKIGRLADEWIKEIRFLRRQNLKLKVALRDIVDMELEGGYAMRLKAVQVLDEATKEEEKHNQ